MSDAKSTPPHPQSATQMRSKRGCHSRVNTEITARFPARYAAIRITKSAPINQKAFAAIHSQCGCQRDQQYAELISQNRLSRHKSDADDTATWRDAQVNASVWHFAFTQQEKRRHSVKRAFSMALR
ncbi:hypothetical protein N4G41_15195 [Kosakonia sacchari]|uniref:hypothetical protein n=1 Tax=Kosakonia sacchari TaxID=1158459 RepID=UPI002ACD2BD2|nr:hypothetical protein [Kosakonia sacchari]MDZ7322979.1 hypothetical protein [Kosakonia sacchari]